MKAVLNERKCPAQGQICKVITTCPEGAVEYEVDESVPLGGRILINDKLCNGCGVCVDACCGLAIDIK